MAVTERPDACVIFELVPQPEGLARDYPATDAATLRNNARLLCLCEDLCPEVAR